MDDEKERKIKAIDDAIIRGVHSVKFENREVVYRNLEDMLKTRNLYLNELNKNKPRSKRTTAVFSRGLK